METVFVLAATNREIDPFIESLAYVRQQEIGMRPVFSGHCGLKHTFAVITGPGIVNAVQALTAAVEKVKPDVIIQTGCAGAFKQAGLGLGDIGLATEEIYHHSGLEAEPPNPSPSPLPFPVLTKKHARYTNRFPVSCGLTEAAADILSQQLTPSGIKVRQGPFATVSTITTTDRRAHRLHERYQACMEQMEGAGTAQVAVLYDIPFIEIRGASNPVGQRDRSRWDIPLAANRIARALLLLLNSEKFMFTDR